MWLKVLMFLCPSKFKKIKLKQSFCFFFELVEKWDELTKNKLKIKIPPRSILCGERVAKVCPYTKYIIRWIGTKAKNNVKYSKIMHAQCAWLESESILGSWRMSILTVDGHHKVCSAFAAPMVKQPGSPSSTHTKEALIFTTIK